MIIPLEVYFDASGNDSRQPVFAVGGWIAEVDQWKRFSGHWRIMLNKAPFRQGVERMFHASELESLKGIYEDWDEGKKQEFQADAYKIIADYQLFPIASAVIKADYEAQKMHFAQFKQGYGGNYYLHCFHDVMKNVRNWLDDHEFEASVHYFFEWGGDGEGAVKNTLARMFDSTNDRKNFRMSGYTVTGKHVLPLQAADIWAYESYKQMVNRIVANPAIRDVRYPYKRLYRNWHSQYQTYWDRENLAELLALYKKLEAQGNLDDEDLVTKLVRDMRGK